MSTPLAILVAGAAIAIATLFVPSGPTYSFMPFGTEGTAALRLNAKSGEIDVCSFDRARADASGKTPMTCGRTWPR